MESHQINQFLLEGKIDVPGVLPHLDGLKNISFVFQTDFGLATLPEEPGLLIIRGPRQYGKSTWLESKIRETIVSFGPGSALYLNGDDVQDHEELHLMIESLLSLYPPDIRIKRLFLDEITAVDDWEKAIKKLSDRGKLREILIVSTGSKAADLRHGSERLPGRKGKLSRSAYLFTPIPFNEFESRCGSIFQSKTWIAYLLTGGCPIACNEIATEGKIPEYVIAMIRDWMYGECVATGRSRGSLLAVLNVLFKSGGNPLSQAKLAREAGLANNTVAAGYIDLLGDLLTVTPSYAWDPSRNIPIRRKPGKFHFINLLAAVAWHPAKIRSIEDFERLETTEQAKFLEWQAAQEIWRRRAVQGEEFPELLSHWTSDEHEIDFVTAPETLLEVKLGPSSPIEFLWFPKSFPKSTLQVVNQRSFKSDRIRGLTIDEFLREGPKTERHITGN